MSPPKVRFLRPNKAFGVKKNYLPKLYKRVMLKSRDKL